MTRGAVPLLAAIVLALATTGCGTDDESGTPAQEETATEPTETDTADAAEETEDAEDAGEQRYPDVIDVEVSPDGATYSFTVTISSPYDTPERYADGWRITDADGTVYGEHTLAHDHANEQPFTRTQDGVEIPDEITEVTVEGRDSEHGYGGGTQTVALPG